MRKVPLHPISLVVLGMLLAACSKKIPSGALRIDLQVNGFAPGCVEVSAQDAAGSHAQAQLKHLTRGDKKVLALEGPWGNDLKVTATAFETLCGEHPVATSTQPASVPATQIGSLEVVLTAPDEDGDGFVDVHAGGTDCNDSPDGGAAVNSAQSEVCNDRDDNCNGAVDEGLPQTTYYRDFDHDGYGTDADTYVGCGPPDSTWVTRAGDCNDTPDAGFSFNPGQREVCNGKDDNCDGQIDEGFDVGSSATCTNAVGCNGTRQCTSLTTADCVAPPYYLDQDGDGHGAGEPVSSCTGVSVSTSNDDCDDTNGALSPGAADVCDQRPNACGDADVDPSCPGAAWADKTQPSPAPADWKTASEDPAGNVWFAGDGDKILLRTGTTFTDKSGSCSGGGDWKASWVDSSGTVYLGGTASGGGGQVVGVPLSGPCVLTLIAGTTAPIRGVVRIPGESNSTHLFAAAHDGKVYVDSLSGPDVVTPAGGTLNAIHGIALNRVFAVGTVHSGPDDFPAAYLRNGTDDWTDLDAKTAAGNVSGSLLGVYVLDSTTAYMVGQHGLALQWNKGTGFTQLPQPNGDTTLTSVIAFNRWSVYATAANNRVYRWDGTSWQDLMPSGNPHSLTAITGLSTSELWAAGNGKLILHWHEP